MPDGVICIRSRGRSLFENKNVEKMKETKKKEEKRIMFLIN
jgi:hypothetical protein